jgi:hypothetical protein
MPCGLGLLARPRGQANLPILAPERLKQTGGGAEPRIERLVHLVFIADIGWDERQVVNGFTEFRGHPSRSNGQEANSDDGGRNLQRAPPLIRRWPSHPCFSCKVEGPPKSSSRDVLVVGFCGIQTDKSCCHRPTAFTSRSTRIGSQLFVGPLARISMP